MIRFLLPALSLAVFVSACGGAAPVVAPLAPVDDAPTGIPYGAAYLVGGDLVLHDLYRDKATTIAAAEGTVTARHASPVGSGSAVIVAGADSVRLIHVDPAAGTARTVTSRPAPVVYTVAWAPNGSSFAYGHYRPTTRDARPAMGVGDILEYHVADGSSRRVGCSASRAVLAWLPDGGLLVRNTDNLYTVDRDGCATRSTVDARRMHQLTASPDGARIAYVHRELVYDRSSRQYVADSTFMLAAPDGSDERTVVNFRYRPTRFAWRPDGSELAYDVQNPDRPEQRLISIFDTAAGTSAYLHPPSADGPSEYDARWAPDGSRILYRQSANGSAVLAVRTFADPYAMVLEGTEGAEPLGWAGPDAVVARLRTGVNRLFPLHGGPPADLPAGEVLAVAAGQ